MIGYLDTSAFVPLLIAEPSSVACQDFWNDADELISSRLLYVETATALAQAHRKSRLDDHTHRASLALLDQLWAQVEIVDVDDKLAPLAAQFAYNFGLRGYDAVHCASADQLDADTVVGASGDLNLLRAWNKLGISTYNTNAG